MFIFKDWIVRFLLFYPVNIIFRVIFAGMIDRRKQEEVLKALRRSPTVALTGPRQVGKTTLAINLADELKSVYLDMESRIDLEKVRDMEAYHEMNRDKLIILDEVQRQPDLFVSLRGIIDSERRKGNKAGQFLFLGSASLELLQQSSESLAGRIAYIELQGIDALEYQVSTPEKLNRLWLRGGFPESLLAETDEDSLLWRKDFIRTYLERDIPQLGPRIPAETLDRFWIMLAHNQGAILNAAHLARNLDVSGVTIARYLDLMVGLLLVRRLRPWTANISKRLTRSPKVYVRDSGLTHALLNIKTFNDLLGHPVSGGSWEGFVIENILSVIPSFVQPYFYRTAEGAEIDLILDFPDRGKWAIEIKRNAAPKLSKGFHIACDDIQASNRYVVYAGKEIFSMGNNITAIPLTDLMSELLKAR